MIAVLFFILGFCVVLLFWMVLTLKERIKKLDNALVAVAWGSGLLEERVEKLENAQPQGGSLVYPQKDQLP